MPIGRTRGFSNTSDVNRLLRQVRTTFRELDRRKPVTEPTMFHDDSERPDAETNEGRVIYNTVTGMLQYSDGDSWNDFLASSVSFAVPTVTYGSAAVEGALATTLRSDATLKYPTSLMSSANSFVWTLTDDASSGTLSPSAGSMILKPATSGQTIIDVDSTTANAITALVRLRPGAGNLTGLAPNLFTANLSSQTLRFWDVIGAFTSQMVSSTMVGYDMSSFSVSPTSGSDTANFLYAFRSLGPLVNNNTGGFTEVATLKLGAPRRTLSNPTVTSAATIAMTCATISATQQAGIYISQATAQQGATDRYGILIDGNNSGTNRYGIKLGGTTTGTPTLAIGLDIAAQGVGTTKYSIRTATDPEYFGGHIHMDDSVKVKMGTAQDVELYYDGTDFVCDPDVVGTGVFDIRGGLKCDSITNDTGLAHGVYTPTRSAETNLDANVTPSEAQYLRVGNTVTVSGRFTADPTLTATATSFELTLPVASNIGAVEDLAGTAFCGAIAGMGAAVTGSVANNTAVVSWIASDVTSQSWSYVYSYQVI